MENTCITMLTRIIFARCTFFNAFELILIFVELRLDKSKQLLIQFVYPFDKLQVRLQETRS